MARRKVHVIGAGISGLTTAWQLEQFGFTDISIYEKHRLGGKLQTLQTQIEGDLVTVEEGPDCFFSRKPGMMAFIHDIGLDDEVIQPVRKQFGLLIGGVVHTVPGGIVTITHIEKESLSQAAFLSEESRARVALEPRIAPGTEIDESIHSFFCRRFGEEFTNFVVEPLLAGTYGGAGNELSMVALYPGYLKLEREFGSLGAAMGDRGQPGGTSSSFLSLKSGMGSLPKKIESELKVSKFFPAVDADFIANRVAEGDVVVLATPAPEASILLRQVNPQASELAARIEHRSSLVVNLYFSEGIPYPEPLTGFLIPPVERHQYGQGGVVFSGSTWSSAKWEGRAGKGSLMRVFCQGPADQLTDAQLTVAAHDFLKQLIPSLKPPKQAWVNRWDNAFPQYKVGHLELIDEIDAALGATPNVFLTGTSYRGIGIPDCIRQARETAQKISA